LKYNKLDGWQKHDIKIQWQRNSVLKYKATKSMILKYNRATHGKKIDIEIQCRKSMILKYKAHQKHYILIWQKNNSILKYNAGCTQKG
jgi:hypothetical protein